ncbi:hypothetical protein DITRI_Ditri18aG0002800 [Diplodiscus trichospermus]
MASGTTPKVRLVRCPNCRLVLPEVANVPVYKCGGCETILVAKNRKGVVKSTSVLQETEAAHTDRLVNVSEHGASTSSNLQEVLPSFPELSKESGGNQNISTDSHSVQTGEKLLIEGQHNDHYEKDQNTSSDGACGKLDENISNEGLQNETRQLQTEFSEYCNVQQPGVSIECSLSTNIHLENAESMFVAEVKSEAEANEKTFLSEGTNSELETTDSEISAGSHSVQNGEKLLIEGQHNDHYEKNQNLSSDGACDKLDENISNEGLQNESRQFKLESSEYCNAQQPGVCIEGSLSTDIHHKNAESMFVAEAKLEANANNETLRLEGTNSGLETNNKVDSNARGLSIDNTPPTGESNLTVTACAAAGEVISSDNLFSSPNEHLEQPHKSEYHRFDLARSTDTFETEEFGSPTSELSCPLEYLSKSATNRSFHAYDGSISSYDGMDDHFSDQQMHSSKNNYKAAKNLVPEEWHRRDKLPAKGMMNGNSGMRDRARNFSSDLIKKHHASENYSKWHRDELLVEPVTHRPVRNWPKLGRDAYYPSQIPFSQRASLRGYESAGPSHELHDESHSDSAFVPLQKAEYTEQESMKLLRMVYELQDQISKTCHLNGKPSGRNSTDVPWMQKHLPKYYYPKQPEEEFYPKYHGRRGQSSSWGLQSRLSRIPFSGGAINTRHNTDNSCLCCHPRDWQHSEQLPPPFRHNGGFCRAHPGHSRYSSYGSCPSSPQRYLESDFSSWSHEIKSDDWRYKDHELKRYLREKNHSVRRHLRPTAGGAPFVTCYHCFILLQLPADFLLFKRRFHQLRCGACSKVLKFSLQKGINIVPYELVAAEPPRSEVEDYSDAINDRMSTSASCSHGYLQADPLSYSDDYGQSFGKSYSTDGDPVCRTQFHDKNMSQNKHKNSMETFDSAGPFSNMSRWKKVSSEIEQLPPRTGGSPLHQLMGYSSPSQLIYGFESLQEAQSALRKTQD